MGAGMAWTLAALPDAEAPALLRYTRAGLETRVAAARADEGRDAAAATAVAIGSAEKTMDSIARLWPAAAPAAQRERERWRELAAIVRPARPAGADPGFPSAAPKCAARSSVYYYDHLREALGADPPETALGKRENGGVLAYEAFNLVDGKRAVSDIRDFLAGAYGPVPIQEVSEYFELLAKARVVTWR